MSRVPWTVRALAGPAVLLLACAGACASDRDEHEVAENPQRVDAESPADLPFTVAGVGAERQDAPTQGAPPPYARRRTAPPAVVAPPANLEEIRQQSRAFIERLRGNPQFRNGLEETVRRAREKGAASQQPTEPGLGIDPD
jgi:hypothetical protein